LSLLVRPATLGTEQGTRAVKAVSVFLVNRRTPAKDAGKADEAFAFQVTLSISSHDGFLPRGDIRGIESDDWDERLADLHYRDVADYAVGHNVAAEWVVLEGKCTQVKSACMPLAPVPSVIPNPDIPGFELGMEELSRLADAADTKNKVSGVVGAYR